jgi:polysaccharide biosynthesis protein PslH
MTAAPSSSDALRVMVVVPFAPRRDSTHGGRVVAQLLMRLAARHRVALVYLARPSSSSIEPELAALCEIVEEVPDEARRPLGARLGPQRARWRHRGHVVGAALGGLPTDAMASQNRGLERAIEWVAETFEPQIVQVETDRAAHYVDAIPQDVAVPRVLVCHEPGVTSAADQAASTSGRQRLAHRFEMATWRRYWRRTLPAYSAIVAFTDRDQQVIEAEMSGLLVERIPLGIDIPATPLSATGTAESLVTFVGGYAHPPNVDAALRLMRDIMPAVRRVVPEARLTLVGANPSAAMYAAAGPADRVTGEVDEVAPYLGEAAVVALPIHLGGGMRVKLLEALAAGKAVVASPLAAEGTGVEDGRQLRLAETDEDAASAIAALLQDPQERERLARTARAWSEAELSWESRVAAYERLYRQLLAGTEHRGSGSSPRSAAAAPRQRSRA